MVMPQVEIDERLVHDLASIHCTIDEIAMICGCHRSTIEVRFSESVAAGKAFGRRRLRKCQFDAAYAGSVPMMIWLGKQVLGQRDLATISIEKIPDDLLVAEVERRLALDAAKA